MSFWSKYGSRRLGSRTRQHRSVFKVTLEACCRRRSIRETETVSPYFLKRSPLFATLTPTVEGGSNMRKAVTFLGASLCLTLATSAVAQNPPDKFPDIPENHWAYQAVESLRAKKIMIGYP